MAANLEILRSKAASAICGTPEMCYEPELVRAIAVSLEEGDDIEVHKIKQALKSKFGKDLDSTYFNLLLRECRKELQATAKADRPESDFITTSTGTIVANVANTIKMMEELPIQYNEFTARPFLTDESPWGTKGNWSDHDDIKCAEWCQHKYLNVEKGTVADAAIAIARSRKPYHHPIREWLQSMTWDGTHRLDTWMVDYLGAPDTPYVRAVSRKWMMSAVKRVFEPGCQSDYTLVLEGQQGRRKSTALRVLCGSEWFTDDIGEDIGNKDSAIGLQGKWIVELAELDAFKRAEMTTVKAWLVRRQDHFRPPYGRRAEDFPRQNVFAASTNKEDWLTDETGGRRFWPVRVGKINIDGLAKVREHLWAEATFAVDAMENIWLSETMELLAAREQAARQDVDPWRNIVEGWANIPQGRGDLRMRSEVGRIYQDDIFEFALSMAPRDRGNMQKTRVARIMTLAGYIKVWERDCEVDDDMVRREYWTYRESEE